MKVFLSWSKDSRIVAEAFARWLPRVIQECADPFISTETEKGDPWFATITKALDDSRLGVVFITKANADEPWLNFESGALLTKFGRQRVCPVLIGLKKSDYAGPLRNLQLTELEDKLDVLALVETINGELERPLKEDVLRSAFDAQWESLEHVLDEWRGLPTTTVAKPTRTTDEKVDELIESVRDLSRLTRQAMTLRYPYRSSDVNALRNFTMHGGPDLLRERFNPLRTEPAPSPEQWQQFIQLMLTDWKPTGENPLSADGPDEEKLPS